MDTCNDKVEPVAYGWEAVDLVVLDGAYDLIYAGKRIKAHEAEWMMDECPETQRQVCAVLRRSS